MPKIRLTCWNKDWNGYNQDPSPVIIGLERQRLSLFVRTRRRKVIGNREVEINSYIEETAIPNFSMPQ